MSVPNPIKAPRDISEGFGGDPTRIWGRKSTPFAAAQAAEKAGVEAISRGLMNVEVRIKGPGSGREAAVRALMSSGLKVTAIMDLTPIPHNGCRPSKKRRV